MKTLSVGGADRLVGGGVPGGRPGPLHRLDRCAAAAAPASGGEQCPVSGARIRAAAEPGLAVRGRSLRRLSQELQNRHGDPVLRAETFVDGARLSGTCYRAANGRHLGSTSGFFRVRGGVPDWPYHGQSKEGFGYERSPDAGRILSAGPRPAPCRPPVRQEPPSVRRRTSRYEHLAGAEDVRQPRGRRYAIADDLTMAVAAHRAGDRGVTAIAEFAAALTQEQRRAIGCFYRPSKRRYTVPTESTFRYFRSAMPPDSLENAMRGTVRPSAVRVDYGMTAVKDHQEILRETSRRSTRRRRQTSTRPSTRGIGGSSPGTAPWSTSADRSGTDAAGFPAADRPSGASACAPIPRPGSAPRNVPTA